MKYLLCTLEYPPQIGGVASYYGNLVSAWPKTDSWKVIDNSKRSLKMDGRLGWLKSIPTLMQALKRESFDRVFIGQILPLGTAALLVRLFKKFDYSIFLHGMDLTFALRSKRKRWLSRLILRQAKQIICANSYVRQLLLEFMPSAEKKILLIHPGATAGAVDKELSAQIQKRYGLEGKKVVFSIGRLVERKGFDKVIEALELISGQDFIYLLAGDGPEKEKLINQARASKVSDRIFFMGRLSEEEKWSTLSLCDIFITTSRDIDGDFEGFGIVYLEANLMGKPVIAGKSGGVADAVIDNETGMLVDPENPEMIAETIERLLSDSSLAVLLGERGRERAIHEFSWRGQAEKMQIELRN